MKTLYLCGAGNSEGVRLALAINEKEARWDRILLLDDAPEKVGRKLLGVEIVGALSLLEDASPESAEVVNLVARTTAGRAAVSRRLEAFGLPFHPLVHPNVDTMGAELARDLIVYHNATIGPESSLGRSSVVFMGAVVGHESHVGHGCVMAANSVLNARVVLGDGVYVGTNATVLPEIEVGAGATIGAGSVVIEDVPPGATVMGVPGQILTPGPRATDEASNRGGMAGAGAASRDPALERAIAGIWSELLDISDVPTDRNFFDLGGRSILALTLPKRIEDATGIPVQVSDVFTHCTVRSMAAHLAGSKQDPTHSRSAARADIRRRLRSKRA